MCGGGLRAREPASSSPAGCSWDWPGRASQGRQRPRHELPGMPSTTTLRGGRDRLRKREKKGLGDAEHSRMWEALGSGEKAGYEGGGHDPQRAGTGASGCRAGQPRFQPARPAAQQTTRRMQFSGIPQPQRRLHGQACRRIPRPLTWSAAEPATADAKAGRSGT